MIVIESFIGCILAFICLRAYDKYQIWKARQAEIAFNKLVAKDIQKFHDEERQDYLCQLYEQQQKDSGVKQ